MLNVTILRVRHHGEEEARKLLPYIKSCHVYSPEEAGSSEDRAIEYENSWETIIQSSVSRSRLKGILLEASQGLPSHMVAFKNKEYDYLFQSKIPIFYAERFSNGCYSANLYMPREDKVACDNLDQGNIEVYIRLVVEDIERYMNGINDRDRNIAGNLEVAEQRIRSRYPTLSQIDPINYTICIGSDHRPEEHTSISITDHDLVDQRCKDLWFQVVATYRNEKMSENLRRLILAAGIDDMIRDKNIEIGQRDLLNMSFDELQTVLSRIIYF